MPVEVLAALAGSKLIEVCWQGAVGNYFHGGCEWFRQQIPTGTPENHDVLKAMHKCFRESMRIMADACRNVDGANRDSRHVRRKLDDYARSRALATLDLSQPDIPDATLEQQIRKIYGQQDQDARSVATDRIIVFVERQVGASLTPAIADVFRHGHGEAAGWAATFELLFAAEVKVNDRVRNILLVSRSNELVAFALANTEQLERMFDKLDTIGDKVDEANDKLDEVLALLKGRSDLTADQYEQVEDAAASLVRSEEPDQQSARDAIIEGDLVAAARKLRADARKNHAASAKQAAYLALPFDHREAMEAFKEVVDLDPTDFWSWIELGRLRVHYDSLASARNCFNSALQHVSNERGWMVLHDEFGKLLLADGDPGKARDEFEAGLAIAECLAAREVHNADRQRALLVGHSKLGDLNAAMDDYVAAREHFEAGLVIAKRFVEREPDNVGWQRDLAAMHSRCGNVARALADHADAHRNFEASHAIAERLAAKEPRNVDWQRNLSVSHDRAGDLDAATGDFAAAHLRFTASFNIRERLAKLEPGNTDWQRNLMISRNLLGSLAHANSKPSLAREHFQAGSAIAERLVAQEPGNAEWQRDLFVSHCKLAQLAETDGNIAAAFARFAAAERVMAALAERRPDHPGFARDLAQVRQDLARLRG